MDVLRAPTNADAERVAIHVRTPFKVWCSDVIVTRVGSRAKVRLENGLITMSPNSRLAIATVIKGTQTPSVLNLTFGKIRTFFNSKEDSLKATKDKQTRFRVKTPSAVVGVRGTDFYVSFDPNKDLTTQATLKGEVEVEQVGTGQKATVMSGQQVDVQKIEKEDLDKVKEIKEALRTENIKKDIKDETMAEQKNTPELPKIEDVVKPLQVVPIEKETVVAIRQTSPLIKKDDEFISQEAVKILGVPEKWIPAQDEIPGDLKDIKNVF